MAEKQLTREITEVLILSKAMIDRIRAQTPSTPDRYSSAFNILLAHDAAELALAAIASFRNKIPKGAKPTLMDYFESLKPLHPEEDVPGKGYFSQLNTVRINIKHKGILFDVKQWASVGTTVYGYMSEWYSRYLGLALDEFDDSVLLEGRETRSAYNGAQKLFAERAYKEVMEKLAIALHAVFMKNPALRQLSVGIPSAEHAIKLAAFGVHANDFLTLQQFLPKVILTLQGPPEIQWDQEQYGHPGNWDKDAARFCLETFLDVAIKLQSANWIPSPIHFSLLYEHKIEVLGDDVGIWSLPEDKPYTFNLKGEIINRKLITTLSKGTLLRGWVRLEKDTSLSGLFQEKDPKKEEVFIAAKIPQEIFGYLPKAHVKITCVPRDHEYVKENFSDLAEIPWQESK